MCVSHSPFTIQHNRNKTAMQMHPHSLILSEGASTTKAPSIPWPTKKESHGIHISKGTMSSAFQRSGMPTSLITSTLADGNSCYRPPDIAMYICLIIRATFLFLTHCQFTHSCRQTLDNDHQPPRLLDQVSRDHVLPNLLGSNERPTFIDLSFSQSKVMSGSLRE